MSGDGGAGMARAIYLAFIGGFFVPLITLIAVIVAYVNRDPGLFYSPHFTFQIRTFWWGVAMQITALVLYLGVVAQAAMGGSFTALLLPLGLMLWWAVFTITRISRGLRALNRGSSTVC